MTDSSGAARTDLGQRMTPRLIWLTCAALFIVAFALYAPSLGYGFVEYDDVRILLDHPKLYDEHSLLASLHEIFFGYFPREEPLLLRDVTWAIDARIFGFHNAFGYHLGNVLLDAANAVLLFLFLVRATGRFSFAAVVAGVFVVLPVHVEPVCWVMGRKDVLSAFFVLATLLCEAEAFRTTQLRRARLLRFAGFLGCTFAIFSKTSAITMVFALAAYRLLADDLAGEQPLRARPLRLRIASVVALAPHAVVSAAAYIWYAGVLKQWGVLPAASAVPLFTRVAELAQMIPLVIALYVRSLFALSDYALVYQWPDSAIPLSTLERAISFGAALAMLAFAIGSALRRRDLLFYVLAFLGLVLPYLHVVSVIRWRADRYMYLASFCVVAIAVQVATELLERASSGLRRVVIGAAGFWALTAAFVCVTNAPRFRNDRALWSYEVGLRQPSLTAYVSLASSFVAEARGMPDVDARLRLLAEAERVANDGIEYYQRIPWRSAIAPKHEYADLHAQLGQISTLRGEPPLAQLALYEASYRIAPTETNTLFLAQAMLRVAVMNDDIELAKKSLRFYAGLLRGHATDAPQRAVSLRVLDAYRRAFPALEAELERLERELSK